MRGGLREMRMRLLVPLYSQIVVTNCKSVRSETPAGNATTVDLSGSVTERDQITGPPVDHGLSTTGRTIHRKGRIGKEARVAGITCANIAEYAGRELGASDWLTVDQSIINQFAECSGDRQWIHVDVERAKRESPYQGPIAHGYLSLSFVAPLSMQVGAIPPDAVAAFNYGLDKVRFLAPVKSGARVRLRVTVIGVERKTDGTMILKTGNTLEIEGSEKPALIAESLALVVPKNAAKSEA
jgi:acyl dehydratase